MFEKETPMNFPLFFVSIACAAIAISIIGCHFASFFIVVANVLLAGAALTFTGALNGATRPMPRYWLFDWQRMLPLRRGSR
jgi:hypothetical protein